MLGETKLRIEVREFNVQLQNRYQKILCLMPALNQTFAFLATIGIGSDALIHVDITGKVLFQHKFKRQVDSMAMISSTEVLILEPRLDQLSILNLVNYQVLEVPFNFMNEQYDQSSIVTFSQTKSFCVVENGRYNDNRFRLSYFVGPFNQKSKPFDVYQTDEEWNYQYLVRKGNESSMVLWFKSRQDQEIQVKSYEIKDKDTGQFKCFKIKNQVGVPYNFNGQIQFSLENAWEVQPGTFCLVANSQKTNLGLKSVHNCVNNNFYWNIQSNQFREATFWFDSKYNDNLIDIHSFGEFSIFRTYFFQNGVVEESPIYYVHNKSEKIVTSDRWVCSYMIKFEYPINGGIVESQYDNAGVSWFKMKVKKIVQTSD